jgi:hypothetical protein
VRDLSQPLEECLQAVQRKSNLQEILRRYPDDRDELIGMLRLSIDLGKLGAPGPDSRFRLRARNHMLAVAAQRRHAQRRNPLNWLPRPAARFAFAAACAFALAAGGVSAVFASNSSLPGDPLYAVKLGAERAQLAVSFDSTARARLQLQFADIRLEEAQRLFAMGRKNEGLALVNEYDAQVLRFNESVASTTLDDRSVTELSRLVQERQAHADASLNALAGSLSAHGDTRTAAIVAQTQTHVDQTLKGSKTDLQAHQTNATPSAHQPKPAGQP